jgi:hypothetical protein
MKISLWRKKKAKHKTKREKPAHSSIPSLLAIT